MLLVAGDGVLPEAPSLPRTNGRLQHLAPSASAQRGAVCLAGVRRVELRADRRSQVSLSKQASSRLTKPTSAQAPGC
eukprot:7446330-Alexandrium_andersonii.AAC.1